MADATGQTCLLVRDILPHMQQLAASQTGW